jgi:hypothetical protein
MEKELNYKITIRVHSQEEHFTTLKNFYDRFDFHIIKLLHWLYEIPKGTLGMSITEDGMEKYVLCAKYHRGNIVVTNYHYSNNIRKDKYLHCFYDPLMLYNKFIEISTSPMHNKLFEENGLPPF